MKILPEKLKKSLKSKKFYSISAIILFFAFFYLLMSQFYAFGVSLTPSMDTYFFLNQKYTALHPRIKDGKAVVFPAPKNFFLWKKYYKANGLHYSKKEFLVKYVACTQGQILNTVGRKDYCNGRFIAQIPKYAVLIPMPHMKIKGFPIWHNYKIPVGYFFAASPDKYGLDSRYFGLVSDSAVKYNTIPLFPKSVIR
jgi:type IV secretory pathway protease TraF